MEIPEQQQALKATISWLRRQKKSTEFDAAQKHTVGYLISTLETALEMTQQPTYFGWKFDILLKLAEEKNG